MCVAGGTLRMCMTCHGRAMGIFWSLALWTTLPSCGIYRRVHDYKHYVLMCIMLEWIEMKQCCLAHLPVICFMQVRRYTFLMTIRATCRVYPGTRLANILAHLAVIGNVCVYIQSIPTKLAPNSALWIIFKIIIILCNKHACVAGLCVCTALKRRKRPTVWVKWHQALLAKERSVLLSVTVSNESVSESAKCGPPGCTRVYD